MPYQLTPDIGTGSIDAEVREILIAALDIAATTEYNRACRLECDMARRARTWARQYANLERILGSLYREEE